MKIKDPQSSNVSPRKTYQKPVLKKEDIKALGATPAPSAIDSTAAATAAVTAVPASRTAIATE